MKDRTKSSVGMHYGAPQKVFQNAKDLRKRMTSAEKLLWEELRHQKLGVKYRRQHPIDSFILDFYCHELRLSIELDGEYHLEKSQKQKDFERTEILNKIGINEIRFSNSAEENNIEEVLEIITLKINKLQNERD